MVEQRSPKPRAVSSSLTAPAKEKDVRRGVFFFGKNNRMNSRHAERARVSLRALPVGDEASKTKRSGRFCAERSETAEPGTARGRSLSSLTAPAIVGAKESFAPFFFAEKHPLASLLLLFRKRSHSRRLFGCKRPHNAFGSLPTFCELHLRCKYFFGRNNRENSRHDDIRAYSRGARSALIPQISDDGHGEAFKYLPFCKTGK